MDFTARTIPFQRFPSIANYTIDNIAEPLVDLSEYGFLIKPYYYEQNISGSLSKCYVRKSVAEMLVRAEKLLPHNYRFLIWDGYRPISVQQSLWNSYKEKVLREFPHIEKEELEKRVGYFVSKPSYDVSKPSLHNTGGAIDLTIVNAEGNQLNMGTDFDDFRKIANTYYFENLDNEEVKYNRRLLYNVMIEVGFTNLPSEWWHYDYGTKFWGYFKNRNALYQGILEL